MIKNLDTKMEFLRAALLAGVGCASLLGASLQAQAPAAGTETTAERIIVTGSNIPTAEEVLASPLDTVSSQDIKVSGGVPDVLQILQKRNADFVGAGNLGSSNANIASGATQGGSVVSLRGLPTLVLFEGRRIADSAAISAGGLVFTDVSIFPTSLISRIEVLKDGASALYGSEAVGGVVNIFLKKDFEGVEIDGRYGFTPSSAISERRMSAIAGVGNETTHITVGFQYFEIDPLFQHDRGYSQPFINATTTFPGGGRDNLGGSANFYILKPGLNSPFDVPGVTPGSIAPPAPGAANQGQYAQLPQAYDNVPFFPTFLSFDLSKLPTSTLDISDTDAYASLEHQIFGKQLELFSNFLYAKNHNESNLNGQPLSNGTGVIILGSQRVDPNTGALVPEDRGAPAPFNPFQLSIDSNTLVGDFRLFANNRYQNKPRRFTNDSSFYRILGGLRSQIAKDWTAEAAVYYSKDQIDFVNANLVDGTQLNALIAGTAVDFNGNPIPPLDFFARNPVGTDPGQLTGAQFNTIFKSNIRSQSSYQEVFDGKLTGFPFHLPGGDLGVVVGGEYRQEGFKLQDSPEIFIGSVPVQDINVGRAVKSAYAEISIPIIGPQMNIPGAYSLDVDLAGRFDHYDGVNEDAKVPKVTLRYQPFKDLTLRATYGNSFVAPTLFQLFGPAATGFSAAIGSLGGDQAQVLALTNPNLVPSKAESYTAGFVYSPSYIPGLTVTADYFRTLQLGIVAALGGNLILNSVDRLGTASPYINQVAFNNFPGQPGAVPVTGPGQLNGNLAAVFYSDPLLNIGGQHLEGFDFSANYSFDLHAYGQAEFGVNAVMFTLNELKTSPRTDYFNINGLDGAEAVGATPNYKITALSRYSYEGASIAVNMNYIPGLDNAAGRDPENEDQFTFQKVGDYLTFDTRLQYEFRAKPAAAAAAQSYSRDGKDSKGMVAGASSVTTPEKTIGSFSRLVDGLTVAVGCNNIFDRVPPTVENANSNTDLSIYDPFGRFLYFEVSKKF